MSNLEPLIKGRSFSNKARSYNMCGIDHAIAYLLEQSLVWSPQREALSISFCRQLNITQDIVVKVKGVSEKRQLYKKDPDVVKSPSEKL